jgi:hypothetical protein
VLPGLREGDYDCRGPVRWLRLHADTGAPHRFPLHPQAAAYLDASLRAAGTGDDVGGWLFRAAQGQGRLEPKPATGGDVLRMVKMSHRAAGLELAFGALTLRAVGIALFLEAGGTLKQVKALGRLRSDAPLARHLGGGPAAKSTGARAPIDCGFRQT